MRRFTILVAFVCVFSTVRTWADAPLFYEGFNYPESEFLAPPDTWDVSTQGPHTDFTDFPGQLHQESGNNWFSAGKSASRPIVGAGNVYDASTGLPAPRTETPSNHVDLTGLSADGTSARIQIPNQPTGARTMYWSAFFRVDDINSLAGAPGLSLNEGGVFVAGFNNTAGSQPGNLTAIGAFLALKRGSANPDSPFRNIYFAGTGTNSQANDCGPAGNWRCANRHFADYDAEHYLLHPEDKPTVHSDSSIAQWGARPQFDAVPLEVGETVFFVGSYQYDPAVADNDVASLWINPDPGTFGDVTPPTANVVAPTDATNNVTYPANDITNIVSYFLRNIGGAPDFSVFDELRIGTTWASVTDPMEPPPPGLLGDFNDDGAVDAADYVIWRKNENTTNTLPNDNGIGGTVGAAHYELWMTHFGDPPPPPGGGSAAVPEPTSLWLLTWTVASALLYRSGRARRERCRI